VRLSSLRKRAAAWYQVFGVAVPIWTTAAPQQVKQFANTIRVIVTEAHNKNKRPKTLVGTFTTGLGDSALAMP